MIRVAARKSDGTKLKLTAHVRSLGEAWDLFHTELKTNKIATDQLVAVQLTIPKQTSGGLMVLGKPPAKKRGRSPRAV